MKSKILIGIVLTVSLLAVVFTSQAESAKVIQDSKEFFQQIQLFADSIALISADYVEPIKAKDLVYGAIRGMMNTLDGYSHFLDPDRFKEMTEETKGEFGGLGIEVGIREGILTVITPIEDTPAFAAGIQAGDKIVKINGDITRDLSLDEAVRKMRGSPGTEITITVVREGVEKMLDITIKRAVIKIRSVKDAKVVGGNIGYIRLLEFQENTVGDVRKHIDKLKKQGIKALIIDVRNNPGGLLYSSVDVADLFLEKGTMIVYTEGRNPKSRLDFRAKRDTKYGDLDLIILANKGSASAAEILAGAIKDNHRGLVVGVPTFGKGSVQTVIPLGDKSAIRLTTAAYYTPSGKNLMDKGVEPDVFVEKIEAERKWVENDKKKSEVFLKVEVLDKKNKKERNTRRKKVKSEEAQVEDEKEYDSQLKTAIGILKGLQLSGYEKKVK